MIDVSVTALRFALPTVIEKAKNDSNIFLARSEFPQEFFGLTPSSQLSVVNGLCNCFTKYCSELKAAHINANHFDGFDSLAIGISILLRKRESYEADFEINFPDIWDSLDIYVKQKAIQAIQYLLQSVGVSIVSREANHGG